MKLLRLLTLNNLVHNRRVLVRHVGTELNLLADSLSRMNLSKFWKLAPKTMNRFPDVITDELYPIEKIWFD